MRVTSAGFQQSDKILLVFLDSVLAAGPVQGQAVGGAGQAGWLFGTVFVEGSNCSWSRWLGFPCSQSLSCSPLDNSYMCSAWYSEVSPVTAMSSLAGTSRAEGSFRLPSANEEKLQMRNSEALTHGGTLWSQVTRKAAGVGIVVVLENEPMLRRTTVGAAGRRRAFRKLPAESGWCGSF